MNYSEKDKIIIENISKLSKANPFLYERIELEKAILGNKYKKIGDLWSIHSLEKGYLENLNKIQKISAELATKYKNKLEEKGSLELTIEDISLYEELVSYHLFEKYRENFQKLIYDDKSYGEKYLFYNEFLDDFQFFFKLNNSKFYQHTKPEEIFALYHQIHRGFYYIFDFIVGSSNAVAELRASVWESIFTHDIYRYKSCLFKDMRNITTLITGPSGTGKELVARAISFSQYIDFDSKKYIFKENYREQFSPLHLSAMSANLIESELFGHKKGAYTGALTDRKGWFELSSKYGTVFLDEIGEIDESIQVKLLRLTQNRSFQPLGSTHSVEFKGKIIAATNRDLSDEINKGSFRKDLYYRFCSDIIITPSLSEQIAGSEKELKRLVEYLANKIIGSEESAELAKETVSWIKKEIGLNYEWPGNIRELEQCIRNIMIRGKYYPANIANLSKLDSFVKNIKDFSLTADDLVTGYCQLVHEQTRNYSKTARKVDLDRRTVKAKVD